MPALIPSPHFSRQTSPSSLSPPVHLYPASVTQVELHPSPLTRLPSSQVCQPLFLKSPHISSQSVTSSGEPPRHSKPASSKQSGLHPSPATRFPSSHWS